MSTLYGVYPESHEIVSGDGELTIRNRFYEVTHELGRGGAIAAIRLLRVSDENLLCEPCGCELSLAGVPRPFAPCGTAQVEVRRQQDEALVIAESPLRDAEGADCGAVLRTSYLHRWGHLKIRQELRLPQDGLEVNRLLLHRWALLPELTHFGVRPGAPVEASPWVGAFGVCQWGRFTPGRAFDCPHESRFVPRYVCMAEPGRRGLEWFVGSELAQWDYQLAGRPGVGSVSIAPRTSPPAVGLSICPLHLATGALRLRGVYRFDSYIGIPILSGQAHQPFLHTAFNRHLWPTAERITDWARRGIRTAHFHHDGDSFRDGLFWRDGSYPPFAAEEMREFDRVIADCHQCGIRVATYFSNKELHPTVRAYQEHGPTWARLPDDRGQQLHNHYSGDEYGAQMCLRSGWLEFHQQYIDTVLSHHALDGTYFDWNVGLYCHNPAHGGSGPTSTDAGGLGTWAFSPLGHWDVDELLELMNWTRRRIGSEGLSIVHNTMAPMAATENLADYIVAMEWGYARLSQGAPPLEELPLEWNFMGARSRGVIGYGCLAPEAPERVQRQLTLRCLLTGVAPWPARDLDLAMFAPLAGRELTGFAFQDWRGKLVAAHEPGVAAAVYYHERQLLALIGELTGQPRQVRCTLDLAAAGLCPSGRYRVQIGGQPARSVEIETPGILELTIPLTADGLVLVEVEPE